MSSRTARRSAGMIAAALSLAALATSTAGAATLTVGNTTDDPGDCSAAATCSLRQAVADANATAGADTIDFALPSPSVISLTNGPLVLNDTAPDELTITGPGAASLTVQRDPAAPPFPVIVVAESSVTMSGFTTSGGAGTTFGAGGIETDGEVVLDRMVVSGNTGDGGGIGGVGGMALRDVTEIRNSLVSGNSVTASGPGGGAGAIVNVGLLRLVNSTITGNTIDGSEDGADAGAIANLGGLVISNNSTISGNSATKGTGGIIGGSPTYIANTILAQNTGGVSADCGAGLASQGHNLVGTVVGCFASLTASDQVATSPPINPLLLGLASNGGPTQTLALQLASPARDAGNPAAPSDARPPPPDELVPCATTDQRGVARPKGTRCDIGAFELVPPPPPPPVAPPVAPPPVAPPPVAPPPVAPPPPAPFVAPPIDHFKCYDVAGRFRARDARLRDQFSASARTVRVARTTSLCNPVSKNGGQVGSPRAHLTCYATRDRNTPPRRRVIVSNQFGVRRLTVLEPVSLCVPSLKRLGTRAPATTPDPERLVDHLRCYSVAPLRTPLTVTLRDQFGAGRSAVVAVTRLCNPVAKNGGAVRRPEAHLVCYTIRDRAPFDRRRVTVRNQFGVARLRVVDEHHLCLPSLKEDLGTLTAARQWRTRG